MLGKYTKKKYRMSPAQIMVIGFAMIILIGAVLLNLPISSNDGKGVGFINALFTATSAVCVTGLVVVDTGTHWTNFGKVIIMMLVQVGGLGFMSMATLFSMIIGKRIYLHERLLIQEAFNQHDLAGLVKLTRGILIMTFVIEGVGAIALSTVFIPEKGILTGIWYSIFHSVTAFCNAGFDLVGDYRSLTPYVENATINIVIASLIALGGLGFPVIFDIAKKRKFSKLSLHSKIVIAMTISLIGIGFILFFALEYNNPKTLGALSLKGKILAALFQSITPRTAGFNTIDLVSMRDSSNFLTIILMFIGGSPASTAGGIKTATLAVLILTVITLIKGKEDVEAFERRISYSIVNKAVGVVAIGLTLVIFVTTVLSLTEPNFDFLKILYEVVSAFGTVGLTLGVTPNLSTPGKLLIAFCMFSGRVGVLTILLALANRTRKNVTRYPEDKVIVG